MFQDVRTAAAAVYCTESRKGKTVATKKVGMITVQ
jgi:hypothetical protein